MFFLQNANAMVQVSSVIVVIVFLHIGATWWCSYRQGRAAKVARVRVEAGSVLSEPYVSVLVPAWQEASTIAQCLGALCQVKYPCWKVIVIAGGRDGTYETVERLARSKYQIKFIRQKEGGKNVALNQGLAMADGEVIVILDADSVVGPQWLPALIQPLLNGASATCGNYLPLKPTWVSRTEEMEKIAAYSIRGSSTLQGSGSIAVKREALEAIGKFLTNVTVGVDWDLSVRLDKHGLRKAFAKDAIVWTQRPATLREFWRNEVRWRRAHIWSLWRHRKWFFRGLGSTLNSVSFYVVAIVIGAGMLATIGSLVAGSSELTTWLLAFEASFLIWVVGRRAALAGEVASYTGHWRWLYLAWTPVALLFVSIAASWWAALTLHKQTPHFKGPRH